MEWKLISEIPGYEDYTNYELNITGDLRNRKTGRLLKWCDNGDGYLKTMVSQRGFKLKNIKKHVSICLLFKPNPGKKPIVDHWNRNKSDNSFDNLRWATYEESNQNKSMFSTNTSGEQHIFSILNCCGKPRWRILIVSHGEQYTKSFPRTSDIIPQHVIQKRDEMKRKYHPTAMPIADSNCSTQGFQDQDMLASPYA